uniref:hypothetical protein n=1 Tax=uncultured Cetobacterium sp. TaxID=527638 RepID=UPI002619DC47
QSETKTPVEEAVNSLPAYNESLYNKFEELSEDIQAGIEGYAYRIYVEQCGMDTKIQKLAFRASRKKYICEFLEKYPEILKNEKNIEEAEVVKPIETVKASNENVIMTDILEVKKMINDAVEIADIVNEYSEDEMRTLKLKIINNVIPIYKRNELTIKILESRMTEYTGV